MLTEAMLGRIREIASANQGAGIPCVHLKADEASELEHWARFGMKAKAIAARYDTDEGYGDDDLIRDFFSTARALDGAK